VAGVSDPGYSSQYRAAVSQLQRRYFLTDRQHFDKTLREGIRLGDREEVF
jgi:hypothetical protein